MRYVYRRWLWYLSKLFWISYDFLLRISRLCVFLFKEKLKFIEILISVVFGRFFGGK